MCYSLLGASVFEFAKNLPNLFEAHYSTCEFADLLPTAGFAILSPLVPAFPQPREITHPFSRTGRN